MHQFKLIKVVFCLLAVAYLLMAAAASYRYKTLVANPVHVWHAVKMIRLDFDTDAPSANSGYATLASSLDTLESIQPRLVKVDTPLSKQTLSDDLYFELSELDQNINAIEHHMKLSREQKKIDESVAQGPALEVDSAIFVASTKTPISNEVLASQSDYFNQLANQSEDLVTEADVSRMASELAVGKNSGARKETVLPQNVLDTVEKSTGIDPDEIEAAFNQ